MSVLYPCPGCERVRNADEGHHLCRECEGYPAKPSPCPFGDPYCPCQDGDPCHYEATADTPAMAPPSGHFGGTVRREPGEPNRTTGDQP